MDSTPQSMGYEEPPSALKSRIGSHRAHSNFNLHNWLAARFPIQEGDAVLDVGCGSGNFSELFARRVGSEGSVLGLDKNQQLIAEARASTPSTVSGVVTYVEANFDEPLPFDDGKRFDWIFGIYALYYSDNASTLFTDLLERLTPNGSFIATGPGPENGIELEELVEEVTGVPASTTHIQLRRRMVDEFAPLLQKIAPEHPLEKTLIETTMTFPNASEFVDYAVSTKLWRDSTEGFTDTVNAALREKLAARVAAYGRVVIPKQMCCLVIDQSQKANKSSA